MAIDLCWGLINAFLSDFRLSVWKFVETFLDSFSHVAKLYVRLQMYESVELDNQRASASYGSV